MYLEGSGDRKKLLDVGCTSNSVSISRRVMLSPIDTEIFPCTCLARLPRPLDTIVAPFSKPLRKRRRSGYKRCAFLRDKALL